MKGASALADSRTNAVPAVEIPPPPQIWNIHGQNTDIVQGYPAFPAQYSGPNSLRDGGQTRETVSLDLLAGVRLWSGAEAHVDGLMWQGFGVGQTLGVESYPNGEAFRLGTEAPNVNFTRVFIRQTIGMGGDTQTVADDALDLAGKVNVSRLVLTVGRFSAKDIFDNNSYANDPRTQFMSWGLMANEAWDYPADALGFTTGLAIELYQPNWAWRYGFFQVPDDSNGTAMDGHVLDAWGMVTELERDYSLVGHPGAVRLLGYLNRAQMGSYAAALSEPGTDIIATRTFRSKYGVGLNAEQEIIKNVGVFTRLGWSDGQHEAWNFSDVDYTITGGVSVKGAAWHRPDDTVGLAGVCNGITRTHQEYLAAGGSGVLAGDGRLRYGWEKSVETYYDVQIWKTLHASVDYQYVTDPAFNQARGPISFFGGRVHWEF
jgi:high affinity Mn2+ porin